MSVDTVAMQAKMERFKVAVDARTSKFQTEYLNRVHRYDEFNACAAGHSSDEAQDAFLRFVEREERGVLAKCRKWTTDDFEAIRALGEGAFGIVHLVRLKGSDKYFAMKQMYKSKEGWNATLRKTCQESARAELQVLKEARSKWVVELFATLQDSDNIYMVMEFLQGGDLIGHIIRKGRFSVVETQFYMAELCEALDTVHRCGFVHRDIKPDNMMLTSAGHLKLSDFRLCKDDANAAADAEAARTGVAELPIGQTMLMDCVGTPQYMAPEVYNVDQGACYGIEADFWSLGVVTFECLVGHVPFHAGNAEGEEARSIIRRLVQTSDRWLHKLLDGAVADGRLTKTSADFIAGALHLDRRQRFTAQQIRQDAFFTGIDFENIHMATPPIVPNVNGPDDAGNLDDLGRHVLKPTDYAAIKDASLEWVDSSYDASAHDLQRPELNAGKFFINPVD